MRLGGWRPALHHLAAPVGASVTQRSCDLLFRVDPRRRGRGVFPPGTHHLRRDTVEVSVRQPGNPHQLY
jgi:hypothetical protein